MKLQGSILLSHSDLEQPRKKTIRVIRIRLDDKRQLRNIRKIQIVKWQG